MIGMQIEMQAGFRKDAFLICIPLLFLTTNDFDLCNCLLFNIYIDVTSWHNNVFEKKIQ